jgi:hypothetical protein
MPPKNGRRFRIGEIMLRALAPQRTHAWAVEACALRSVAVLCTNGPAQESFEPTGGDPFARRK